METCEYNQQVICTEKLDAFMSSVGLYTCVIIYGAGHFGQMCARYLLRKCVKIKCFIDCDSRLYEDKPFFLDIVSPITAKADYNNETIIITPSIGSEGIEELLILAGFPFDKIYKLQYEMLPYKLVLPDTKQMTPSQLAYMDKTLENPQVTILSLIYNTPEHYLRRAIESVLNQSFRNFEYLIIDHASDDTVTSRIINEYAGLDKRIKVYRIEINFELERQHGRDSLSLRESLASKISELIKTEYICTLDSDDYYGNDFLQYTYSTISKENADAVCVQSTVYDEDNHERITPGWYPIVSERIITCNEKDKWLAFAETDMPKAWWAMLVTTRVFCEALDTTWSDKHDIFTDTMLSFEVLKACKKMVYTRDIYHFYTRRKTSVFNGIRSIDFDYMIRRFCWMINEWVGNTRVKYEELNICSDLYAYTLTQYVVDMVIHYTMQICNRYTAAELLDYYNKLNKLLANSYIRKLINSKKYYRDWYDNIYLEI